MLKLNSDKTEIIILGTDAARAKIDVTQYHENQEVSYS